MDCHNRITHFDCFWERNTIAVVGEFQGDLRETGAKSLRGRAPCRAIRRAFEDALESEDID
jgi:hypothetical protein